MYERGPGIRIRKVVAHEAQTNALFVFDIWDQFRFHGAVMEKEFVVTETHIAPIYYLL